MHISPLQLGSGDSTLFTNLTGCHSIAMPGRYVFVYQHHEDDHSISSHKVTGHAIGSVETSRIQEKVIDLDILCAGSVDILYVVTDSIVKSSLHVRHAHAHVKCSYVVISQPHMKMGIDAAIFLHDCETIADVFAVSLLKSHARVTMKAHITLTPHAQKAQGYLSEENIFLGEDIYVNALPMLDVQTNDVKASHGATLSRLQDTVLFYMTAKGIPSDIAVSLLVRSYLVKARDHVGYINDEMLELCCRMSS